MPGINLIFSWDKDIENWNNLFLKTHHLDKHNPQYSEKHILPYGLSLEKLVRHFLE
jgi:hypothetical protein